MTLLEKLARAARRMSEATKRGHSTSAHRTPTNPPAPTRLVPLQRGVPPTSKLPQPESGSGGEGVRERIAAELRAYPEVRWDRFIEYGGKVRAYGWLPRADGRADFLLLDFNAATGALTDWITSAHPHPASVVERLESDQSVECQRVEDHFGVPNAVRLESTPTEDGATLIAAERRRQVEQEGWTPEHDDAHTDESLRRAALCYARLELGGGWDVPDDWPWEPEAWKPRDNVTCLVKAGALLAAEIDRLQRERNSRSDRLQAQHSPEEGRLARHVERASSDVRGSRLYSHSPEEGKKTGDRCEGTDTASQPDGLSVADQSCDSLSPWGRGQSRCAMPKGHAGAHVAAGATAWGDPYLPAPALSDQDRERLKRIAREVEAQDRNFQAQIDAARRDAAFLRDLADKTPEPETRRFKTQGKGVEAMLYEGSFPLDFLRGRESVGAQPGRKGSCQIDTGEDIVRVDPGELIVRSLDGSLYVLFPTEEGESDE